MSVVNEHKYKLETTMHIHFFTLKIKHCNRPSLVATNAEKISMPRAGRRPAGNETEKISMTCAGQRPAGNDTEKIRVDQ